MGNTALITGASSGIGREFARLHALKGGDVILTARREAELNDLKAELERDHGIAAHVVPLDLGAEGGAAALIEQIDQAGLQVDILINNAGFGGQGAHVERDIALEQSMIDLNVKALVTLSHEFGRRMAEGGGGKILNVASTAGLIPGPYQAVYYATKAFVISYSNALDHELRPNGVTVTALAPGLVATEFQDVADLKDTTIAKAPAASAKSVAQYGYRAMKAGRLIAINEGLLAFLLYWVVPLLPRRLVMKFIAKAQS